jgi:hypothetical protein
VSAGPAAELRVDARDRALDRCATHKWEDVAFPAHHTLNARELSVAGALRTATAESEPV